MDSTSSFIGHLYSELSQNSHVNLGISALARRGCIEKLQRTKPNEQKRTAKTLLPTTLVCYDFKPTNFSSAKFASSKKINRRKIKTCKATGWKALPAQTGPPKANSYAIFC